MTKEKTTIILDRCIEYSLYIMIVFMPISTAAIEAFFGFALLFFLLKKALKPDFGFIKNPTHLFLFLFFGFCVLSLLNSGVYLTKSLKALFFKWLEYIFIFILVEDTLNTSKRLRNALCILLATSALIGLDGLVQYFTGVDFLRQRTLQSGITAAFKNQNNFSAYLVPVLLFVISLTFFPQLKKRYRMTLSLLGILLGTCLILTFTRGAWLGFLAGLVFMLFFSHRTKIVISLICIFFIISHIPHHSSQG